MKRAVRLILIAVTTVVVCFVAYLLLVVHGHSEAHPEIRVQVNDVAGQPLSGVEVVFADWFHDGIWRGLQNETNWAKDERERLRAKIQLAITNERGEAEVEGNFRVTVYVWHQWVDQRGTLFLSKSNYAPVEVRFEDKSYRKAILKKEMKVPVTMKKTNG